MAGSKPVRDLSVRRGWAKGQTHSLMVVNLYSVF